MAAFRNTPFSVDMPVNERTPNWVAYRLSKAQMLSIKAHSTHWRATCSYNRSSNSVDFTDYVRANLQAIDITSFLGHGICKKVEYINIRGHAAYQKTARFWQVLNTYIIHIDSSISSDTSDPPRSPRLSNQGQRQVFGEGGGGVAGDENYITLITWDEMERPGNLESVETWEMSSLC
eukprot:gene8266-14215_t